MRINEVIVEDVLDEIIEDEANDPVIMHLIALLEHIHERYRETHQIPKITADSLIKLVQTEYPQFSLNILLKAKQNNDKVAGLIKDIKDDEFGVKYVYITPSADEVEYSSAVIDGNGPKTDPERTVNTMAKSALAKRS